jgi:hypothetical protein
VEVPRITRPSIYPGCTVESLTEDSLGQTAQFALTPNVWMTLFGVQDSQIPNINSRVHKRIRALESEHSGTRLKENKKALGARRLEQQPIDKPYPPP